MFSCFNDSIMPIVGYKFYGRSVRPYFQAPEKKSNTILGMTLFSLIIFGAFAIRPSLTTISRLRQEVKKAREAEVLLDEKINKLSQAQVNYQLASKNVELVNRALPKSAAVPEILENLALAAGRHNIALNETKFGAVEGDDPKIIPLTITVTGNLANLEKFIIELEEGVRQMDVQRVKMSRGSESLENLTAEIGLVTYYYE